MSRWQRATRREEAILIAFGLGVAAPFVLEMMDRGGAPNEVANAALLTFALGISAAMSVALLETIRPGD